LPTGIVIPPSDNKTRLVAAAVVLSRHPPLPTTTGGESTHFTSAFI
jgi:hypothetical protein